MIVKILGAFDVTIGILFVFSYLFHIIPHSWLIVFAIYLAVKGVIFLLSADIASLFDIVVAIVIYASTFFNIPVLLGAIVSLFLIQKGIVSMVS